MSRVPTSRFLVSLQRRAALGLRPVTAPIMLFLPLGILLGPSASGILSANALEHLQFVVSIGLATLGVFIGIAAGREGRPALRLFAASGLEAAVTIVIVGGAVLVLLRVWGLPLGLSNGLIALVLGLCASASAAPAVEHEGEPAWQTAGRVADLDDVLPIALGGVVLAMTAATGMQPPGAALLTIGIGLTGGLIGWLLVERAEGAAERGLFVLGTLSLLGGAPAYLHLSPLFVGMVAGWLWVVAPGRCDVVIASELRKLQHPLIVLLLIAAGAAVNRTVPGIWLLAPYVVFRIAGKLVGGWVASRVAPVAPSDLGAYLIPPGVIGIAFALNVHQVAPDGAEAVVFAVAVGAIACEVLGLFVRPERRLA